MAKEKNEHAQGHEHTDGKSSPLQAKEHGHEHGHNHPHDHRHDVSHAHHHHEANTRSGRILTVRAASGLSGDIMLAGLASIAGLDDQELESLVKELKLPVLEGTVKIEARSINHIAGVGCNITLPHEHAHRSLGDIRKMIADSAMPDEARELSNRAFVILGEAEAAVHGKRLDEVTFHEVGALDSILDTCLVCRIFTILNPARFVCSPLPVTDGVIHCAHGHVASPAPAVLRLLEGMPVTAFAGTGETVTPTAVSLLKALGAEFGGWPGMTIEKTVISYGTKVFENAPNGAIWALGVE